MRISQKGILTWITMINLFFKTFLGQRLQIGIWEIRLEERAGEKLGGERLEAQESVSKYLQCKMSSQPCYRGVGVFYNPLRESNHWGVINPDITGSGAGHVQPTSLETGLGTRYFQSGT
jgi:hypothetical protein